MIHCASTVSFDPPIDQAFETNVGGAVGLYAALLATRAPTPTSCTSRRPTSAASARASFPEAALTHEVDWRAEFEAARAARSRVELASRQPEVLRRFMADARAKHGKEGPLAVVARGRGALASSGSRPSSSTTAARGPRASAGPTSTRSRRRSPSAPPSRLWAAAGHRLSFVRPAIIESALRHPYPGWIDGFKVADPLIIAYGRGMLPEFPGRARQRARRDPRRLRRERHPRRRRQPRRRPASPQYFHVSSGASNPLPIHRMFDERQHVLHGQPAADRRQRPHRGRRPGRFPGGRKVERAVHSRSAQDAARAGSPRLPSTDRDPRPCAEVDRAPSRPRVAAQLHRALPRLRADRDHLRRPQHPGAAATLADSARRGVARHRLRRGRHRLGGLLPEGALPRRSRR